MNIFRKINGILKFIIFLRYNLEIVLERGLIIVGMIMSRDNWIVLWEE